MLLVWSIVIIICLHSHKGKYLKIYEMKLNKIILDSIPNVWITKVYVQRFDCDTITF